MITTGAAKEAIATFSESANPTSAGSENGTRVLPDRVGACSDARANGFRTPLNVLES
jgi:hypothetical protein